MEAPTVNQIAGDMAGRMRKRRVKQGLTDKKRSPRRRASLCIINAGRELWIGKAAKNSFYGQQHNHATPWPRFSESGRLEPLTPKLEPTLSNTTRSRHEPTVLAGCKAVKTRVCGQQHDHASPWPRFSESGRLEPLTPKLKSALSNTARPLH